MIGFLIFELILESNLGLYAEDAEECLVVESCSVGF